MSSVCKEKRPKLKPGERKDDEKFNILTEDEKKADEILKQMRYVINDNYYYWEFTTLVIRKFCFLVSLYIRR